MTPDKPSSLQSFRRTRLRGSTLPCATLASILVFSACGGSTDSSLPTTDGPGGSATDPSGSSGSKPGSSGTSGGDKDNPDTPTPPANVDLRADTNRDGTIDFDDATDDDGEDAWDAKHGAVFLANIDDDEDRCPTTGTDVDLPKCNDAADEVVNGDDDALDLARLKTKPFASADDGTKATITVTSPERVRLFRVKDGAFTVFASDDELTTADVRAGIELAIEARDIVRDTKDWDGFCDVTFTVDENGTKESDKVRLRVAPLMTYHHLLPAETTYVTALNVASSIATRNDLAAAATAAGVAAPKNVTSTQDQWTQDFFETGFMSMPGANGVQHAMRVNIRSANEFQPNSSTNPLRSAGKIVFALRGKDSAAVQQYDPAREGDDDTLNSFGNLETVPPYTNAGKTYPLGRILRGSISNYHPDTTFLTMMESQSVQPPIYIDTSWLLVGHVDETLSFVKAPSARGWVVLANDPTLAKTMLQQQVQAGHGDESMFVGKSWDGRTSAEVTISEVLSDTEVMQASAEAATEVAAQLAILKSEIGLTEDEIIRIPYLHMPYSQGSIAYQPGMVNGLYISPTHFVAPDPHGPVIGGQDIFKAAMETKLAPLGITVHWAEDWDLYHANMGEVHCGTNATRQIPDAKWWESGR